MSRNTRLEHNTPADIERTSFAIIGEELEARGIALPPETEPVVKRVIHTTADFDYAANLRFTENAVERGGLALRSGCTIVTDTNMARAGISKPALQKLGGDLVCYMADPAVAARAKEEGTTRATVSMAVAAEEHPDAVFAKLDTVSSGRRTFFRPWSSGSRWGLSTWWRAKRPSLPPVKHGGSPPSFPWAARAGAMSPPPSVTPFCTGRPTCRTRRTGDGTEFFYTCPNL